MKVGDYSKVAYFRLDGGSSRLYTQEYVDKKNKVINDLLKRISDLEFEVERLERVVKVKDEGFKASTEDLCEESTKIDKAIEYIEKTYLIDYEYEKRYKLKDQWYAIELLDILKGVDK